MSTTYYGITKNQVVSVSYDDIIKNIAKSDFDITIEEGGDGSEGRYRLKLNNGEFFAELSERQKRILVLEHEGMSDWLSNGDFNLEKYLGENTYFWLDQDTTNLFYGLTRYGANEDRFAPIVLKAVLGCEDVVDEHDDFFDDDYEEDAA